MSAENQFDLEDQDRWRPEKHSVFRTFFGYFVPLFLVLSLFMLGLLGGDWLRTANLINANERLQVDIVKNTLTRDLENIGPDMRTLVQSRAFARFLDNENDETKAELEHTFSLFADHKRL